VANSSPEGSPEQTTSHSVTAVVKSESPGASVADTSPSRQSIPSPQEPSSEFTLLSDQDLHLFNEGTHHKLYDKLGAHVTVVAGTWGTNFGVWAPDAAAVSVIGDFNGWDPRANALSVRGNSGIWEGFIPRLERGTVYKYHIVSRHNGYRVDKADPFAFMNETPPRTASVVWNLDYQWGDAEWMRERGKKIALDAPISIYELHIGSWRRSEDNRPPSYRELAEPLADYLERMGFTHVEFLPVMEHPFYGSWGYQITGFFAATSRYGTPQDLMVLIDVLHQRGIGVILDWVPSHFPTDEHGLAYFDGTHLFEHADPRKGFHPDWGSLIFNYGRNEVRSFLLSNALFWIEKFHADALRVDAVASMLYLDYSRKHGEWIPNQFGGRENIEAISFLRRVNEDVYKNFPDVQVIAEESTAWPMVSRPTYVGGLGFGMKWDMGWMHDMLRYMSNDPIHRKYHHNDLTFRMMYAFTENFVLPLSHDEVVHGKGSLINKMPGDDWRKFANLRLLFGYMFAQPGKKLLFMGGEFGQWREWNHDGGLDWHLLGSTPHAALQRWVADLNAAYRNIPAFYELDTDPGGFEWIDCCDTEQSVVTLLRRSKSDPDRILVGAFNFTPVPRFNYQFGVPAGGRWREVLNSDAVWYGGSGQGNLGGVDAAPIPLHGRTHSIVATLPPLGAVFFVNEPEEAIADAEDEGPVEEELTA
jgi:1,4-alpha-glucan branching enzyme